MQSALFNTSFLSFLASLHFWSYHKLQGKVFATPLRLYVLMTCFAADSMQCSIVPSTSSMHRSSPPQVWAKLDLQLVLQNSSKLSLLCTVPFYSHGRLRQHFCLHDISIELQPYGMPSASLPNECWQGWQAFRFKLCVHAECCSSVSDRTRVHTLQ